MSNEEIAEQLYDELQHNRIINHNQYSDRLYELLDIAHPDEVRVGGYVGDIENIMHNKWSFGFCDMCGEVIFYDDDQWYDLAMCEPEEQEILEETLPKWQNEVANIIQDVCPTCFAKLLKKGEEDV